MFVVCLVGVWQRNFEPAVCVCKVRYRTNTPQVQNWSVFGSVITLPNTDEAQDKHLWTTTNNFKQVQLYTPWWWITYDPKHVGVIFNFVSFKLLYNVDFNI